MDIFELAKARILTGKGGNTPGGGGSGGSTAYPKDVNFYDYDGTLLHSYTVAEAQALTELPPLPEQEGLICQGWNWTLANIKSVNGAVDAGATYITDDGKTRLYISIPNEDRLTVPLNFYQSKANGVRINWGDGTENNGTGGTGHLQFKHTYLSAGDYVITLEVVSGECWLGQSSKSVIGGDLDYDNNHVYSNMLKKVEIGANVTTIYNFGLGCCFSLSSITMPVGMKEVKGSAFYNCYSLSCIVVPESLKWFADKSCYYCTSLKVLSFPITFVGGDEYCFAFCTTLSRIVQHKGQVYSYYFQGCKLLSDVTLPKNGTWITPYTFSSTAALTRLKIPSTITEINANAFAGCYRMKVLDFTSLPHVPTCQSSSFSSIPSDCEIRVPSALYEEWIAATNWSAHASKIVPV